MSPTSDPKPASTSVGLDVSPMPRARPRAVWQRTRFWIVDVFAVMVAFSGGLLVGANLIR